MKMKLEIPLPIKSFENGKLLTYKQNVVQWRKSKQYNSQNLNFYPKMIFQS